MKHRPDYESRVYFIVMGFGLFAGSIAVSAVITLILKGFSG